MTDRDERTLPAALAAAARAHGEARYLIDPETGHAYTYEAFLREVDALADALSVVGVREGDHVALAADNGVGPAAAFYAILAVGAIVVLANPHLKRDELSYVLDNSEATHLVTAAGAGGPDLGGEAPAARALPLGLEARMLRAIPPEHVAAPGTALILYTSGTTGRPKGVMLTHANLLAGAENAARAQLLGPDDIAMCVLPFYHVNGLSVTLLAPMLSGGAVIVPPHFSASRFWTQAYAYGATWFSGVPTILSILLARPAAEHDEPRAAVGAERMRFARSASASLPAAVQRAFEERFGIPVVETYGISECAGQVAANPLPAAALPGGRSGAAAAERGHAASGAAPAAPGATDPRRFGSVGVGVGDELRVADGEVLVRGANVSPGYYRNASETERLFADGWFRTGDLGRLDSDGYLYLEGRSKELINRAGEKFSPLEIDDALYGVEGVELAAAVGVPNEFWGEEPVAFVTQKPGAGLTERELLDACRARLADFKVPHRVLLVDDLPKGPSGKIQRLRLRDVYESCRYDVTLDAAACKECGYCAVVCPRDIFRPAPAFNARGYRPYQAVDAERCIGCRRCFFACPDFAIDVTPREVSGSGGAAVSASTVGSTVARTPTGARSENSSAVDGRATSANSTKEVQTV